VYTAAPERYEQMQYRRSGRSGLQLPAISLGLWHNFGHDRPYELGRSIVTPRVGKRDIIAAGAPGHGKAALFYCSSLLPPGAAGSRCP